MSETPQAAAARSKRNEAERQRQIRLRRAEAAAVDRALVDGFALACAVPGSKPAGDVIADALRRATRTVRDERGLHWAEARQVVVWRLECARLATTGGH